MKKDRTSLSKTKIKRIIDTIYETHPYEAPVYNISEVKYVGSGIGIGIAGKLVEPIGFDAFVEKIKSIFNIEHFRVSNNFEDKL